MQIMKRDELILYEVSRWRCILGRQIKILAEFDGQRACDRRIKKLIENQYLERKRYIYGIAGILSITNKSKKIFEINLPISKPRIDQIVHDIAVVDTVIYFVKERKISLKDILSERQIRNLKVFGQREHMPDFIYKSGQNQYSVEIELSLKAKQRLEKNILKNYTEYDYQFWIVPQTKIKIKEILEENQKKYGDIEIIDLEVIDEFIRKQQ